MRLSLRIPISVMDVCVHGFISVAKALLSHQLFGCECWYSKSSVPVCTYVFERKKINFVRDDRC